MSAVTTALLIIFFLLVTIGIGVAIFFFLRQDIGNGGDDGDVPEPDTTYCVSVKPLSYFDTTPQPYTDFYIRSNSCADDTTPIFTFRGYGQQVDGTTGWCISNFSPVPRLNVVANHARLSQDSTCEDGFVLYLPTSANFSSRLVPIYVNTVNVTGTADGTSVNFKTYQYSLTKNTGSDQTFERIIYAFPGE